MDELLNYLYEILPFVIIVLPFYIIARISIRKNLHKKEKTQPPAHEAWLGALSLYILIMSVLLLPPNWTLHADGSLTLLKEGYENSYIPFDSLFNCIGEILSGAGFFTSLFNFFKPVLLYIPIGFCSALLWEKFRKLRITTAFCLTLSLLFETIQFFTYRGVSVDSVILNTIGGICGCLIVRLIAKFSPNYPDKFTVKFYSKKKA